MSASSDDDGGDGEPGDGARTESGPGDGAKLQVATPARGAHGGGERQAVSPGAVADDARCAENSGRAGGRSAGRAAE